MNKDINKAVRTKALCKEQEIVKNAIAKIKESKQKRNPSYFAAIQPWNSVYKKSEAESIATNIMRILKRTGDTWRDLSWEEYKLERLKDSDFDEREKKWFQMSVLYCCSDEKARQFCIDWN